MTDGSDTPKPAAAPKKRLTRRELERRRLLIRSFGLGIAAVTAGLVGWYPVYKRLFDRLRPPGALDEREFLAACIKCGQCVQVCPVEAIKLADGDEGYGLGVPYIDARAQACDFSCDAVQCVLACPTGALSHEIAHKEEVTMGFARLSRPESCLAMKGEGFKGLARGYDFEGLLRYEEIDRWDPQPVASYPYDLEICDLCVRECPIKGAISLEPMSDDPADKRRIPVVHEACVGCGTCEMICPTEPASIIIDTELTLEAQA
ncbi:4Fe-4S dicluster domain-containing protein [Pseudothioclava arenosa]|uniref:4Fe-4S ferredoxin n=1 Tax=Pseudothioclava arenosa TaxID=1795308 RepID=A0A2A4CRS6_9RHOB|nr:4Fe-4S dicluster domain-containing protein [Pseudothioclava arenosa]PCD77177.1 4Fe-4S ferredoxin [Pseudothioclava arenosa]